MVRRFARSAGLVLIGGSLAVAGTVPALAAPAAAAGSGGWRVVARFSAAKEFVGLHSVVAFSARDAWAAGAEGAGATSQSALVLSWTGRGWHKASLPSSVRKALTGGATVTGSSAADIWLYNQTGWARWNGKGWASGKIPLAVKGHPSQSGQLLAFSPTDAWFIGQYFTAGQSHPFAERFNGRSWRAMPAPPITDFVLSGASASAICVMSGQFGSSSNATTVLACWNGSRWNRLKLPAALGHSRAIVGSILVRSLHDIWVGGGQISQSDGTRGLAAHWTGGRWHVTVLPAVTTLGTDVLDLLVSDLHGGLWATGDCDCGGPAWRLWHYTGGQWTGPALPVIGGTAGLVNGIAAVPGTRSAWAAGTRFTNKFSDGVMLANGRLPG
jgi:hypothetical protein